VGEAAKTPAQRQHLSGYSHPLYAESLSEFGKPRKLPRSGGWILERTIPGQLATDAMGCYPLFACEEWSQLGPDILELQGQLVSLALVADTFGQYSRAQLEECFHRVIPFKRHFLIDLGVPLGRAVSKHHRYYSRRALRRLDVERCLAPEGFADEWARLYSVLVQRKELRGIKAFSRSAFAKQLRVPGTVVFRAVFDGVTVGADWYYVQGDVAYGHLAAFDEEGYRRGAPYALQWFALEYFAAQDIRWVDLGGTAGLQPSDGDGLDRFKKGWATGTRMAYFCGQVLDQRKYRELARGAPGDYFPSYRNHEFE
jgi:hypothetical protein